MGCICSINRRLQTTCEQLLLLKLRMSDLGHDVELLSNKISEIDDNLSHLIDMSHATSQVKGNLDLVAGNLQRVERNTNSIGMEMVNMNSDHRSLRSSMRNMTTTIMKANCHHRESMYANWSPGEHAEEGPIDEGHVYAVPMYPKHSR